MGKTSITYRLTAGGSAVMETIGAGSDHEMVSMYTMDGDDFVMTHYCMLGNQPRMKAAKENAANTVAFTCTGGGNMNCATDTHMHGARFNFVDKNTVNTEWDNMEKGKVAATYKFALKRKEK